MIHTHDHYWDCECEASYINNVRDTRCNHCGAHYDEAPNSRTDEIITAVCATLLRQYKRAHPAHEKITESPVFIEDITEILRKRGESI